MFACAMQGLNFKLPNVVAAMFFLFMPDMCASILCKDTARLTMASFICCLEKSRQNEQNDIERNDTGAVVRAE